MGLTTVQRDCAASDVFMNVFIVKPRQLGNSCNVCGQFVGCIIISASVRGLQNMLDCVFEISCDLPLTF